MNCNAKKELRQHISASRTLYVKEPHVAREPRFGHPYYSQSLYAVVLGERLKTKREGTAETDKGIYAQ